MPEVIKNPASAVQLFSDLQFIYLTCSYLLLSLSSCEAAGWRFPLGRCKKCKEADQSQCSSERSCCSFDVPLAETAQQQIKVPEKKKRAGNTDRSSFSEKQIIERYVCLVFFRSCRSSSLARPFVFGCRTVGHVSPTQANVQTHKTHKRSRFLHSPHAGLYLVSATTSVSALFLFY